MPPPGDLTARHPGRHSRGRAGARHEELGRAQGRLRQGAQQGHEVGPGIRVRGLEEWGGVREGALGDEVMLRVAEGRGGGLRGRVREVAVAGAEGGRGIRGGRGRRRGVGDVGLGLRRRRGGGHEELGHVEVRGRRRGRRRLVRVPRGRHEGSDRRVAAGRIGERAVGPDLRPSTEEEGRQEILQRAVEMVAAVTSG